MKVLITGANGLLGQQLVKLLVDRGHQVVATARGLSRLPLGLQSKCNYHHADLTEDASIERLVLIQKPEVLVHAGAMTQVDQCELNKDLSFATNALATGNLLRHSEKIGCHFIFLSTDFVFDGNKGNYREEDETKAVNWYGSTKIQAEKMVSKGSVPWAIVRTCLVYGKTRTGSRNNFVSWVKDKLEKKETIQVVDDQIRTPTFVEDLAKGISLAMEKKSCGIFHVSGRDFLTPYEMAIKTTLHLGLNKDLILRAGAATFTQVATRPLKTGFIIDKAKKELGFEPLSFDEGLCTTLAE
jgi:dTDP-4-dehydrorhamnose reductase